MSKILHLFLSSPFIVFLVIPSLSFAQTPCNSGMAGSYPCNNMAMLSFVPSSTLGGGSMNDIWGWTDPATGNEYALVGKSNGTAFVDVTDPVNPVYLGSLPPHSSNSSWRDIKVYDNHAFIVSEAGGSGVQVFDLTQLPSVMSPPVTFSETSYFPLGGGGDAHNMVMNENTGYAYPVGANCGGGPIFLNVSNPMSISDEGCYGGDGYTHDAIAFIYLGPDTEHVGKEIIIASNTDSQTIIDVSDKSAPTQLSRTTYANSSYTHQGWITRDHKYLLFDDELDESNQGVNTTTYILDIQDLDNPFIVGTFVHSTAAIDHNMYVKGNYVYQSNYRAGLRVLEMTDLSTASLTEVGFFDVYPANDNAAFSGTWSNYPYFESGNIILTSMGDGLFIVRPEVLPHFYIEAPEVVIEICQGDNAEFDLDLKALYGFTNPVSLTETGSPASATADFSTTTVSPSGTSILTISNTDAVPAGNYSINIVGTATGGYHSISVGLIVKAPPPGTALAAPPNGVVGVPVNQPVVWTTVQEADSYNLEIALDPSFNNIVETHTGLTNILHIPTSLLPGTTYYWRVVCQNVCGPSVSSHVFSMTTEFLLPIELVSFWGEPASKSINLYWETASEQNAAGFSIERRTDNSDFSKIGWLASKGTSSSGADYTFEDNSVAPGTTYYYRLKMEDQDATFKYSEVISEKLDLVTPQLEIYPNPVKDELTIRIVSTDEQVSQLKIHDLSGRLIYEGTAELNEGINELKIANPNWAEGMYFLSASNNDISKPLRFVVIKD
ncbi:MAG: choice-of-anchor B family protein [Bacteroidota bacterium]